MDNPSGNNSIRSGDFGTLCYITGDSDGFGVNWDSSVDAGHNCSGTCKNGHGWFVSYDEIRLVEEDDSELLFTAPQSEYTVEFHYPSYQI